MKFYVILDFKTRLAGSSASLCYAGLLVPVLGEPAKLALRKDVEVAQ